MTAYLAIVSARFRTLLQYRAAAVAGIVTQTFFGVVRLSILEAFFRASTGPQPMTAADMPAYIWLGQALFQMVPWALDRDVAAQIRSGGVAYELLRPVDLYGFWFSRALALRTAPVLLRAAPMVVIAAAFFGMGPPPSVASAAAFAASVLSALLISCALTVLISISMLRTVSGEGASQALLIAVMVFSGLIIPLPFFPEWLQPFVRWCPFSGLLDVPLRIYTGNIPAGEAAVFIARQLAWVVALVALGRVSLSWGLRRLSVLGG
ncbi:MAG: ABC-2 type transport system permease [Planctomycetota bacterium]|nr:MAG: ABC-2 type transport system permease [Planctomycetota bacterium]